MTPHRRSHAWLADRGLRSLLAPVFSMTRFLLVLAIVTLHTRTLAAQLARKGDTIYVADRFLGASATAYHLFAKFHTAADRAREMRLDKIISGEGARSRTFGDIVVSANFDGNGYLASWIVAGPRRIVERYVQQVRQRMGDRRIIYDSSIRRLVVRCACD